MTLYSFSVGLQTPLDSQSGGGTSYSHHKGCNMFDFTLPLATQSRDVIERLQRAGFVAYLAGGCVRDALLGRTPKDFDVATDAAPETVREIFGKRRTLAFGASFGVIGVLGSATGPTEVATFRSDGEYSDGRRPDTVRFGSAEQDAMRRDFTINGMFYDPLAEKLIDYVGGEADLRDRKVRAIGDPQQRIDEDKLRMLRAVRFAAALGFELDARTTAAIQNCAQDVVIVSGERIGAEMRRMSVGTGAAQAYELLYSTNLLMHVWPNVHLRFSQKQDQCLSLISHTAKLSFEVVCAGLIAMSQDDPTSELRELANAWKLSGDEQRAMAKAVEHRDQVLRADQLPWSLVQPIIASRDAAAIVGLATSWAEAFGMPCQGVEFAKARLAWPREQLDPLPLLTGDTLRELGYKPSPKFGSVLQTIRDAQLNQELTCRNEAVKRARQLLES